MLFGIGEWMLSNGEPKKSSGDLNLINPLDLHLNPGPIPGGIPLQVDKDSQDQWTRSKLSASDDVESGDAFGKELSLEEELSLQAKESDRFALKKSSNPFSKEISLDNKEHGHTRQVLEH
jgi:hypothetical protein